jgi:phage shock protein PspC (stress-responsive transcriptional regulator)
MSLEYWNNLNSGETMESSKGASFIQFLNKVKRSRSDKKLGGVCGGFAAHSDIPAWLYRALFITLLLVNGLGALAYIALWICMPAEDISASTEPVAEQSVDTATVQ